MADISAAEKWLYAEGRPIDIGYWEVLKTGSSDNLLRELALYRNDDGGFGHSLEPDVRLASSSVLATTVALQMLSLCDAPYSNDLVSGALRYLGNSFDPESKLWAIVPSNVQDAPHAPWWEPRPIREHSLNPQAEIVGYLHRFSGLDSTKKRDALRLGVFRELMSRDSIEMHEALAVDRMFHELDATTAGRDEALRHLDSLVVPQIELDPSQWGGYGLKPLGFIRYPSHRLHVNMKSAIDDNFRYFSDTQNRDGSWDASWTWLGTYPEAWPAVERDIRSLATREVLELFHRFRDQ